MTRSPDAEVAPRGEGATTRDPLALADPSLKVPPRGSRAKRDAFAMVPQSVLYDPRLSANAVRVYGVLTRHANDDGACWPSQARVGELAHLRRTATSDAIGELVDAGHVTVERRGRTLTNIYRVMFARADSLSSDDRQGGERCPPGRRSDVRQGGEEREPKEREPLNERHARAANNGSEEGDEMHVTVRSDGFAYDDAGRPVTVATSEMLATTTSSQLAAIPDVAFEAFWAVWPRKVAKRAAAKAWAHAIKRASPADIIAGARRYTTDPNLPEPKYIPYPATWLNGDRWLDSPEPQRRSGPRGLSAIGSTHQRRNGQQRIVIEATSVEEAQ